MSSTRLTQVREYPIPCTDEMVRGILAGTKTKTRWVVKPQPEPWMVNGYPVDGDGYGGETRRGLSSDELRAALRARCPYGQPGDRLWAREAWASEAGLDTCAPSTFHHWPVWYRADDSYDLRGGFHTGQPRGRWRRSIHMPRWASRITLEVTDVRVERVQEITEEDAIAEGLHQRHTREGSSYHYDRDVSPGGWWTDPIDAFRQLWESTDGRRPGCSWDANPWVWVIGFRRVDP